MDQKVRYPNKENKSNKDNRANCYQGEKKMAVLPSLNHSISNESIISSAGYTTNTIPCL